MPDCRNVGADLQGWPSWERQTRVTGIAVPVITVRTKLLKMLYGLHRRRFSPTWFGTMAGKDIMTEFQRLSEFDSRQECWTQRRRWTVLRPGMLLWATNRMQRMPLCSQRFAMLSKCCDLKKSMKQVMSALSCLQVCCLLLLPCHACRQWKNR
jgi:hypothetical protein